MTNEITGNVLYRKQKAKREVKKAARNPANMSKPVQISSENQLQTLLSSSKVVVADCEYA